MSNQKGNHKAWMQEQRDRLTATGHRLRDVVSVGWEGAGRGLKALAHVGGEFFTASWDGRYKSANARAQSDAKAPHPKALRPPTTPVAAIAEGRLPQQIPSTPIAFVRPNRLSVAAIPAPVQQIPIFDVTAREQARKIVDSTVSSTADRSELAKVDRATERQTEQQLAAQLEALFTKKCEEFSTRLEHHLDLFCQQTSTRLDVLSAEAIRHFSEALNQQATEALSSLMSDWAEQNRVLVDTECHNALDRFAARMEKLSVARLESHRKEIQNLSASLKSRLRGVAHALQDLGPNSYRS